MKEVIFTDLDGTLLDENYSFKKAKPALDLVREKKIPLVICTSKTRAEIEVYRKKLRNNHPFISENGGAIFIPKKYFTKKFKYTKKTKDYYIIELGTPYEQLKKVLKTIERKTSSVSSTLYPDDYKCNSKTYEDDHRYYNCLISANFW